MTICKTREQIPRRRRQARRGSVMFLALLMIMAVLAAAAFSIDVAYMQLVQTQLRTATDAATRAGALGLATGSVDDARQDVKDIAALNNVAGVPLVLDDADIVFGTAHQPAGQPAAAVHVHNLGHRTSTPSEFRGDARRDLPSGDVTLFLGPRLWGSGPFTTDEGRGLDNGRPGHRRRVGPLWIHGYGRCRDDARFAAADLW